MSGHSEFLCPEERPQPLFAAIDVSELSGGQQCS